MSNIRLILILICILIGCIIFVGCTSQQSTGSTTTGTPVTTNSPPIATSETVCPPSENATPYIFINPISNHTVGDVFEINGTTNLGIDSKIVLSIAETLNPGITPADYRYSGTSGCVTIHRNMCGPNYWSYSVNLSGYHPYRIYWTQAYEEPKLNATILEGFNETSFYVHP